LDVEQILKKMAGLPTFIGVDLCAVNDRGSFGDTPLHVAAIWGDVCMGKLLLDAGADLMVTGEHGYTPLHEAVEQGNAGFARLLLNAGASSEVKNDDGYTARDLAQRSTSAEIRSLFARG
jgi:ankyrin repeat protein